MAPKQPHDPVYISAITSNIQAGIDAKDLTNFVMLVGPNGSGKSTALHAVKLALCGHIDDVGGRPEMAAAYLLDDLKPTA